MIAIFTILGLILSGGGAYAIYDGWPYLVLERGFTQVIIGSIASSAGLILLSLAWVLKEIRAVRRALVEALALRPEQPAPEVVVAEPPPAASMPAEYPSFARVAAPAAIGAAAGVVATGAVAQALAASDDEAPPAPASTDRDLFGALVTRSLEEQEPAAEDESEEAHEAVPAVAEPAEPLPDMFDEAPLSLPEDLPALPPEPAETPVEIEAELHEPDERAKAAVQFSDEDWAFTRHDEQVPVDDRASDEPAADEQPTGPVEAAETPVAAQGEGELDEFSALRASLAGHLNEPERETGRIEPSFSAEPDPFAVAESWMDRASPRREPWLDTPPAEEPEPAAADEAPIWPPRTEAPAFDAPAEAVAAEPEAAADMLADKEADDFEPAEAAAPVVAEEPPVDEAPAAADSRPASDEGIVGAYQVGDAHFTIYADGSIRARTPDGEYSFASMDELKVYLASEKSRLGV